MSSRFQYINLQDQETKLKTQEQLQEAEDYDINIDQEQENEEEAISLCDFPLNSNEPENSLSPKSQDNLRRSSSQPSDFFEFFNDSISDESYNLSHAEDIIFGGKLIPYYKFEQPSNNNSPFDHRILKSYMSQDDDDNSSINLSRRYCESLPETNVTRSDSMSDTMTNTVMMRSSRSLDYKKLRRNSSLVMKSEVSDMNRSFHSKGFVLSKPRDDCYVLKGSISNIKNYNNYKPSWYGLMFGGLVKVNRPELDIRDMKHRQSRRITMFPTTVTRDANNDRRSFWGFDLLKVLSCKNYSSVAFVEPSIVNSVS